MKDETMNAYAAQLQDMTKTDLYALAQDAQIPGRSKMTKAQLIDALTAAQAEVLAAQTPEVEEYYSDHTPVDNQVAAIDITARKSLPYRNLSPEDVKLNRNVRVDITRYDQGRADARMVDRYGFEFTAQVVREGRRWVLMEDSISGPKPLTIRARSLNKLTKTWARKLGNWADDIRVVRDF